MNAESRHPPANDFEGPVATPSSWPRFGLRQLFGVILGLSVPLAVLQGEPMEVVLSVCLAVLFYLVIGLLIYLLAEKSIDMIARAWAYRQWSLLTLGNRWMPFVALFALYLGLLAIGLGNHVLHTSVSQGWIAVTWGWLLVPLTTLTLVWWRRRRTVVDVPVPSHEVATDE